MKLRIITKELAGTCGPVPVMALEDGTILPGQKKTGLSATACEVPQFTVTFLVDGRTISVDKSE